MIREAINKAVGGGHLSEDEAAAAMQVIMDGMATDAQISALITALRMKGETAAEITGFARTMRAKATGIAVNDPKAVDTCGTGGDGKHTLNVSTIAAFVAAGAGVAVAKHGNRSVSSTCGSADLLAALGVNIEIPPEKVERCIAGAGIGFLFAPMLHQAMRFAVKPRKEIAIRTIFNVLGPLTNPARVSCQLLGVFDGGLTETLAEVLRGLGSVRAFVVHGTDGLDEISISAPTVVSELKNGEVHSYEIAPEDFGLQRSELNAIVGGNAETNRGIALKILNGAPSAGRDIVVLNAGAAIAASDSSLSIADGVASAVESIDSGNAKKKLELLIKTSNAD